MKLWTASTIGLESDLTTTIHPDRDSAAKRVMKDMGLPMTAEDEACIDLLLICDEWMVRMDGACDIREHDISI